MRESCQFGPFLFQDCRLNTGTEASPGLNIATNTVAKATNISSLATKNSGSVTTMATIFLCVDDQ